MRTIILSLFLLISVFCSFAQITQKSSQPLSVYTVKGTIVDSISNEGVQYATICFASVRSPQNPIKVLTSDEKGNFVATFNASPGVYNVSVQFVGMKNAVKKSPLPLARIKLLWAEYTWEKLRHSWARLLS